MTQEIKMRLSNMRLTGADKNYHFNQLHKFAQQFDSRKISAVEFGKQDIRGGFSICLFDNRHCVPSRSFSIINGKCWVMSLDIMRQMRRLVTNLLDLLTQLRTARQHNE